MKAVIIQARMGSTRLPGKVLAMLPGGTVLAHVIDRCKRAHLVDSVVVATTLSDEDDRVVSLCKELGVPCFRGSSDDVLSRFYETASLYEVDTIVRITADCPLIAPELIDECLVVFEESGADYASNIIPEPRRLIRGLDVEVFSFEALSRAHVQAKSSAEREHVTPYIRQNVLKAFTLAPVPTATIYVRPFRLTLDYPEDMQVCEKIYEALWRDDSFLETKDVITFLEVHPEIASLNRECIQKP